MANCVECGKVYEAKRVSSKYCSAACRKLAFHARKLLKLAFPEQNAKNAKDGTLKQGATENAKAAAQTRAGCSDPITRKDQRSWPGIRMAVQERRRRDAEDGRPEGITDSQWNYMKMKREQAGDPDYVGAGGGV